MFGFILAGLLSFYTVFTVILLMTSKYDALIEPLDDKRFVIKDTYCIGFFLCELFHVDFKGKLALKLRQDINVLYGEKYSDYYVRVYYAQRLSVSVLVIYVILFLLCVSNGSDRLLIAVIGAVIVAIINYYFFSLPHAIVEENSSLYLLQFPNVASTMALLVNAGMIISDAWEVVALSGNDDLHKQMRIVLNDINSGVSMETALSRFANRCATPEIRKFTSSIIQGMEKGNRELAVAMRSMSKELWSSKKQRVLQLAELAGNKILIPILLIFIGILVMVMVPIVTNIF